MRRVELKPGSNKIWDPGRGHDGQDYGDHILLLPGFNATILIADEMCTAGGSHSFVAFLARLRIPVKVTFFEAATKEVEEDSSFSFLSSKRDMI